MINLPKNNDKYLWTQHAKDKMIYYRISESLVKRIVRFPRRKEEGVAKNTIAVMQSAGSQKNRSEIWVMYQEINAKLETKSAEQTLKNVLLGNTPKIRIISTWRYPGVSQAGKKIPIPDEILQELENVI